MDTTETTHISFCAGYGGIDLGLRRVLPSCRTVAYVEIESFAIANLVAKMEAGDLDAAPVWTDIKTFPAEPFRGLVDIISGGYPCQPFSAAGSRLGTKDPRHLWPFLRRAIRVIQPGRVFLENVEGHISLGLSTVVSDLEEDGYRATWGIFSAAEVGASHQRKRVFILGELANARHLSGCAELWKQQEECSKEFQGGTELASPRCVNREVSTERQQSAKPVFRNNEQKRRAFPARPGEQQFDWEEPRTVADADSRGNRRKSCDMGEEETTQGEGGNQPAQTAICEGETRNKTSCVQQTESELGRTTDGAGCRVDATTNRVDRLRLLGNGVVAQTAARAWTVLSKRFEHYLWRQSP